MPARSALLVGSLPFANEEACMRRALDVLGPALIALPDGEVGDKTPQFPAATAAPGSSTPSRS